MEERPIRQSAVLLAEEPVRVKRKRSSRRKGEKRRVSHDSAQHSAPQESKSVAVDLMEELLDRGMVSSVVSEDKTIEDKKESKPTELLSTTGSSEASSAGMERMMYRALASFQWQRQSAAQAPREIEKQSEKDLEWGMAAMAAPSTNQEQCSFAIDLSDSDEDEEIPVPEPPVPMPVKESKLKRFLKNKRERADSKGHVPSEEQLEASELSEDQTHQLSKKKKVLVWGLVSCVLILFIITISLAISVAKRNSGDTDRDAADTSTEDNEGGNVAPSTPSIQTQAPTEFRNPFLDVSEPPSSSPSLNSLPVPVDSPTESDSQTNIPSTSPVRGTLAPVVMDPATSIPNESPSLRCFETPQELYDAVDIYVGDSFRETPLEDSIASIVYGYPIGTWCVERLDSFQTTFASSREPMMANFSADLDGWNMSGARNLANMFSGAWSFNGSISSWDVSRVTNMQSMFREAKSFNGDLSQWKTVQVRTMNRMFRGANSFEGLNISQWITSSVEDMNRMFWRASKVHVDSLNSWDVSSVTSISGMFWNAQSFNGAIDQWDVSLVRTANDFLRDTLSFNQSLASWNLSSMMSMRRFAFGARMFSQDLCAWEIPETTVVESMFTRTPCPAPNSTTCFSCGGAA